MHDGQYSIRNNGACASIEHQAPSVSVKGSPPPGVPVGYDACRGCKIAMACRLSMVIVKDGCWDTVLGITQLT